MSFKLLGLPRLSGGLGQLLPGIPTLSWGVVPASITLRGSICGSIAIPIAMSVDSLAGVGTKSLDFSADALFLTFSRMCNPGHCKLK